MPRISAFFGITIWMYFNDHQPPHFHAEYGGEEALIVIGSGDLYQGHLSRRALRLVQEWEELHRAELFAILRDARVNRREDRGRCNSDDRRDPQGCGQPLPGGCHAPPGP